MIIQISLNNNKYRYTTYTGMKTVTYSAAFIRDTIASNRSLPTAASQ